MRTIVVSLLIRGIAPNYLLKGLSSACLPSPPSLFNSYFHHVLRCPLPFFFTTLFEGVARLLTDAIAFINSL